MDKKSGTKQPSKNKKQVLAKNLRTIFIDCEDPSVRKSIEEVAKSSSRLAFKIVDKAEEAEAIIIDNIKKWVEIEKKGWDGTVVINTHDDEKKIGKHKRHDEVTYHFVFRGHVALFVHMSINVFHFMKGGTKNKK